DRRCDRQGDYAGQRPGWLNGHGSHRYRRSVLGRLPRQHDHRGWTERLLTMERGACNRRLAHSPLDLSHDDADARDDRPVASVCERQRAATNRAPLVFHVPTSLAFDRAHPDPSLMAPWLFWLLLGLIAGSLAKFIMP